MNQTVEERDNHSPTNAYMNGDYDLKAAADRLDHISVERRVNADSGIQLSRCTKTVEWPNAYRVVETKSVKQLVFAKGSPVDGENMTNDIEEVVAHVQGIIWRHDLPPFRNQEITAKRVKYLRQGVSLTGLGTPTFEAAINGIFDIYSLFSGHVPRDKLKPCAFLDTYGEFTSIETSNRYFSSIKDCGPTVKHISFPSEIDPHGILSSFENTSYIHSENNVVEFYERVLSDTGEMKYIKMSPVRFQIGDVVDAQMTLTLVPLPKNEYKMICILRSLTMLDNSFSQKAFASQAAYKLLTNIRAPGVYTMIKRRVGYDDEERSRIRKKLGEMVIDDGSLEKQHDDGAREEGQ
ncbi:hypothetical protein F5887DRAFT_1131417 [Amanita rubescens]|nr:hypothetical protein F5887DRAFT_1131417 [Amanita rubescens]